MCREFIRVQFYNATNQTHIDSYGWNQRRNGSHCKPFPRANLTCREDKERESESWCLLYAGFLHVSGSISKLGQSPTVHPTQYRIDSFFFFLFFFFFKLFSYCDQITEPTITRTLTSKLEGAKTMKLTFCQVCCSTRREQKDCIAPVLSLHNIFPLQVIENHVQS